MALAIALHVLSATIWVGGMFFAYVALRPAASATLQEPSLRLSLWAAAFQRFFPWVWVAVVVLLGSGYFMVFTAFGGFAHLPWYVDTMQGIGWLMMLLYAHVYFAPYRRLLRGVTTGEWLGAGRALAQIRRIVGVNLALGLLLIAIATGGRLL